MTRARSAAPRVRCGHGGGAVQHAHAGAPPGHTAPAARARALTGPTWPASGAPAPRVSACDRAPGRHRRRGQQGGKCTCVPARWDRRLTDVLCATRLARRPRPRGCAHARRPSVAHHCVGSVGSHGGGRHGVCRQGRVRARCRREGSSVDCRRARTPFVVQEGSHKLEERARAHRAHERVARGACTARAWSPRPPSTLPILAGARAARVCAPPDGRRVRPSPPCAHAFVATALAMRRRRSRRSRAPIPRPDSLPRQPRARA